MSLFTQALTILVHRLSTPFENLLRLALACQREIAQRKAHVTQYVKATFSAGRRWQLLGQRLVALGLTLTMIFPPPVLAGSFSLREGLSFRVIWAQIKAAVTTEVPSLQDPLERPEPEIKPNQPRENKATLEAKVTKLKSELPNKLELYVGQRLSLSVLPTDNKDNPIHGLQVDAESSDKKVALVTSDGFIVAGNPGKTDILCKAGTQTATISVTVVAAPKVKKPEATQKISFRRFSGARVLNAAWNSQERGRVTKVSNSFAAAPRVNTAAAAFQYSGPPTSYQTTQTADTGRPALKTETSAPTPAAATGGTERPGSADFNFSVPLVNLLGRGPAASLGLFYNSRVWKKTAYSAYLFDNETWLAPGFALGYGKILVGETNFYQGPNPGTLRLFDVIDGQGTHHEFEGSNGDFQTKDGTYTKFSDPTPYAYHSTSYIGTMIYADGTRIDYGAGIQTGYSQFGNNNAYYSRDMEAYPVKIMDRNGNYIKVNYVNGVGPKISSLEDSLGRYVRFYYAANGDLISITVPGYAGGDDLQVARFYYQDLTITAGFQNPGSGTSNPGTKRVLKYIYLPGTKAGWKYDYSTYGMIYQMKQLRGMTCTSPSIPSVADSVGNEGLVAATTTYNYPTIASNLTDVPQFTQRTDDWAGNTTGGAAVTSFASDATAGTVTVTDPYGIITQTKKFITGNYVGLVQEISTQKMVNNVPTVLAKTVLEYDPDPAYIYRNFRVIRSTSTVTVGSGQFKSKVVEYSYDAYNNITLAIEKGYDGNEVRRTENTYETGTGWINQRLLRLPKTVLVKSASGTVLARTDFVYDKSDTGVAGTNLLARSNAAGSDDVSHHDLSFNPNEPVAFAGYYQPDPNDPDCQDSQCFANGVPGCDGTCSQIPVYASPYNAATNYRGNVTKVKRWAQPASTEAASLEANETNFTYDIAGNNVTATASCCNLKTYTYVKANEYAFPTQVARGASGQLTTQATYDFNTSLTRTSVDENGRTTTVDYYSDSLRPYQTTRPDGGKTQNYYFDQLYATPDANHMNSYVLTRVYTTASSYGNTYQYFNGIGQTTRSMAHYSVASTATAMSDVEYDLIGRPLRRNNPYYGANGRLAPIGQTWTYTYSDDLNRVTSVVAPDNTTVTINYDGSTTLGTVQTVTDQAGKQRRSITDALGRLLEMQEPDATGSVGADATVPGTGQRTTYQYDAVDNLVKTTQTSSLGETQNRYFKYDGLSRLTFERQPELAVLYYAPDSLTGNNDWSKKIAYDLQGKVTGIWDGRGTIANFTYDSLNRVSTIGYTLGGSTVATPTVTYTYDTAATGYYNLGRLTEVKTAASTSPAIPETKIQYNYDQMGQVAQHNQVVNGIVYPMTYGYNLAGQLTSKTYPSNRVVNYNYQTGYGLTSINDASRTYASGITYTAHGAMSSATLGNGAVQTLAFNNRLQLSQIGLTMSGTELQRYDYNYGQYDSTNVTLDATKNNGQIAKIEGFISGAKQWEQRHSYDEMGRLKVAGEYRGDNGQVSWRAQYGYDRFGNRYQNAEAQTNLNTGLTYVNVAQGITATSGDIDRTTNRFRTAAGITYDGGGNVLTDNKFKVNASYAYDANNRVVSTNNGAMTAVYDGAGQRVRATEASGTTTSVYDGAGQLIAEYNGTTLIREYIGNLATVEGTTVRYLMSDHLGSNRVVMNDTGGVVARHDYLPFGEEITAITATMGMRSSGQGYGATDLTRTKFALMERENANGLDHTMYRKAETRSGRWNSPDPYGRSLRKTDPQSFNRYQYTQNNPINSIDPMGLDAPPPYASQDMLLAYNAYQQGVQNAIWGGGSFGSGYSSFFGMTPSGSFFQTVYADGSVRFSGIGVNIVEKAVDSPYDASNRNSFGPILSFNISFSGGIGFGSMQISGSYSQNIGFNFGTRDLIGWNTVACSVLGGGYPKNPAEPNGFPNAVVFGGYAGANVGGAFTWGATKASDLAGTSASLQINSPISLNKISGGNFDTSGAVKSIGLSGGPTLGSGVFAGYNYTPASSIWTGNGVKNKAVNLCGQMNDSIRRIYGVP